MPIRYEVAAECGGTPPGSASVTMWRWGDTNNDGYVSVVDVQMVILAIQGYYDFSTIVTDDLAGSGPCVPQQILNVTDVLMVKFAFQGVDFRDTDCDEPCP